MAAHNITVHPIHLGLSATASIEPEFTGSPDWYADYGARHEADGAEGRLVSMFTFNQPWEMWEMHPRGSEVVLCTAGRLTLHQEHADGSKDTVVLGPGDYAINAPGTWHTADVDGDVSAVFITSGLGTTHRPRE
jgi:mannose-6-phosphate isomerase-like protein (cupin superfamily)